MKILKLKPTISNHGKPKEARAREFAIILLISSIVLFAPESFAANAGGETGAFADIYGKISGWASGTAGKLITLVTLLFGAVGGVLGFNPRLVFGCIGVGLMLSFSKAIVEVLF